MGIRDRIMARADLTPMRTGPLKNLDGMATALNTDGTTAVQTRFVNTRMVVAECPDAVVILQALDNAVTNSGAKFLVSSLRQEMGLDMGLTANRNIIDGLTTGLTPTLTAAQAAQLKNMALLPVVVGRLDVEAALFNPDGSAK